MKKSYVFLVLIFIGSFVIAENIKDNPQSQPITKTEKFQQTKNGIIIKGYKDIGKVADRYGAEFEITIYEFTNLKTKNKDYSFVASITKEGKYSSDTASSWVDYEEIEDLIKGYTYLSKIDSNLSSLDNFETTYSTNGDLKLTAYNNSVGQIAYAVSCGNYSKETIFLSKEEFATFGELLKSANNEIDKIKVKVKI